MLFVSNCLLLFLTSWVDSIKTGFSLRNSPIWEENNSKLANRENYGSFHYGDDNVFWLGPDSKWTHYNIADLCDFPLVLRLDLLSFFQTKLNLNTLLSKFNLQHLTGGLSWRVEQISIISRKSFYEDIKMNQWKFHNTLAFL